MVPVLVLALAVAGAPAALSAATIDRSFGGDLDGNVSNYELACLVAGCTSAQRAFIDATYVTPSQGLFSKQVAIAAQSATSVMAAPLIFAEIPVEVGNAFNAGPAFRFIFDQNEAGGANANLSLDTLRVRATGTNTATQALQTVTIWEFNAAAINLLQPPPDPAATALRLNWTGQVNTATPQGTGADFAFYLPVNAVIAAGVEAGVVFNGGSEVTIDWSQSSWSAGPEQVVLVGFADDVFFDVDAPIVPLPPTVLLLLGGLAAAGLGLRRRRRG